MGNCIYCNESAGFLRKSHQECEAKHSLGWAQMLTLATQAALGSKSTDRLDAQLREVAVESRVPEARLREAIIQGWERAVEHFLEDGKLDRAEEHQLAEYKNRFAFSQSEADRNGAYSRMVKGATLRDLLDGRLPERVVVEGHLPFNFRKTEKLIWLFPDTEYLEDRKRREFVGATHGASIRIARGFYYRVGAFRGRPIEKTETVRLARGILCVTNQHLYYSGGAKNFRIRHDKIVSIQPFEDGVTIQRDTQTAKPQTFITADGWFTYNLLMNVSYL
jgi:hypothetical protein